MMGRLRLILSHRFFLFTIIFLALIIITGLIIFSPFALSELTHFRKNWSQLSDIGQTYGAVSALLSSLALGGVIISLLYQARDSQTAREQAARTLQHELLRMAMDEPALMTAMGAPWGLPIPSESESIREYIYIQMWVSYLAGNYAIGGITESAVRWAAAHEFFNSKAGRNYWEAIGQTQMATSKGRYNRFHRLLDDEYRKVISSGAPVADPVVTSGPAWRAGRLQIIGRGQIKKGAIVAAAAIVGVSVGGILHRRILGSRLWPSNWQQLKASYSRD